MTGTHVERGRLSYTKRATTVDADVDVLPPRVSDLLPDYFDAYRRPADRTDPEPFDDLQELFLEG